MLGEIKWPNICLGCLKSNYEVELYHRNHLHQNKYVHEEYKSTTITTTKIYRSIRSDTYLCPDCYKIGKKASLKIKIFSFIILFAFIPISFIIANGDLVRTLLWILIVYPMVFVILIVIGARFMSSRDMKLIQDPFDYFLYVLVAGKGGKIKAQENFILLKFKNPDFIKKLDAFNGWNATVRPPNLAILKKKGKQFIPKPEVFHEPPTLYLNKVDSKENEEQDEVDWEWENN